VIILGLINLSFSKSEKCFKNQKLKKRPCRRAPRRQGPGAAMHGPAQEIGSCRRVPGRQGFNALGYGGRSQPPWATTPDVHLSGTALRVPKKPGESCLKPAKNKSETHLLLRHTHKARPTLRWPPRPIGVAQSKAPSSRFRLARGLTPPSSGFRLARGLTPPSSGFRLARGLTPPSSRYHIARGLTSASLEAPSQAHLLPHAGTSI
jgi:hypothetical protein